MTKQEILNAVENGESVWYLINEVYELKTSEHTNKFISRSDDYCYTDANGVDRCAPLDMIYKTKAEAKHYLHHANITRTETLPFLTWEEFKEGVELSTTAKNGEKLKLYIGLIPDDSIYYMYMKLGNKQQNVGEATEANFYKAYDECVRLFRGEE